MDVKTYAPPVVVGESDEKLPLPRQELSQSHLQAGDQLFAVELPGAKEDKK